MSDLKKQKDKFKEVELKRTVEKVCPDCDTEVMHWLHFAAAGPIPKFKSRLYEKNSRINKRIFVHDGSVTELECQVIVISVDKKLNLSKIGTIVKYAGDEIVNAASQLAPQTEGSVVEVDGFNLPSDKVFLAVAPTGRDTPENMDLLRDCYQRSLDMILEKGYRSVTFPCLGNDDLRLPRDKCAKAALKIFREWMEKNWEHLDSLIIARFRTEDRVLYDRLLHKYFPTVQ